MPNFFYDERVHDKFVFANQDDYLLELEKYMDLSVLPSDSKGAANT